MLLKMNGEPLENLEQFKKEKAEEALVLVTYARAQLRRSARPAAVSRSRLTPIVRASRAQTVT
jgi:hypothetical protein